MINTITVIRVYEQVCLLPKEIVQYESDVIPEVGDSVEVKDEGTFIVKRRTFVTDKNRIKLYVANDEKQLNS